MPGSEAASSLSPVASSNRDRPSAARSGLVIAIAAYFFGIGGGATPALAESGRLADFNLTLTSRSPGSPSGLNLHLLLRAANDPNAKPSPLRAAVVQGPSGLRFDTGAVTQCSASNVELRALGPKACPPESQLTIGSFTGVTGFGPPVDPFVGDDYLFNGPNQLIEVITSHGTPLSPAFDRLSISGSTLTAHPPATPGGPPDGEAAVRSIDFQVPVRVAGDRSLITTPPGCPPAGEWTTTATFTFANGSTDTVASRTPCDRGSSGGIVVQRGSEGEAGPPAPGLRLAIHPRRVRAGRRVRLRLRVSSPAPGCVKGTTVRVGGRTSRTDGRGRAVMSVKFRHPGPQRILATAPGCAPASVLVRVLAARHAAAPLLLAGL